MSKMSTLSKEELIGMIEDLIEKTVIDPIYKVYSKSFVIEYLRKSILVNKRYKYKKLKVVILLFPFEQRVLINLKKSLRSSDIVAKFDNSVLIILNDTTQIGAFKVRERLNRFFCTRGEMIEIKPEDELDKVLRKIVRSIYIFN